MNADFRKDETHERLTRFNETIQILIDGLNDHPLELIQRQPREGAWSLGQMYLHILDDTEWFVGQMKAAMVTNENIDKEMHADAKEMFRNNGFPDIQIEGPATNTFIPQPQSKGELAIRFRVIKDEVNRLFTTFDPASASGKTAHPGLQFFNAVEWMQFAEMHMRHHLRQKERIVADLSGARS